MQGIRRALVLAAALASILAGTNGCKKAVEKRVLHVIWTSDILTLDPNERFEFATDTYAMNVFEPLLRFDHKMSYTGVLAARWEIADGRTWRFLLRPGVTFHDGSPLTADDVVFTLERVRAQKGSEIAPFLAGITSVRSVDPLTVEIVSDRPAGLLAVLSFVYVLPQAALRKEGELGFFQKPIGSGPYVFVSRTPGDRLVLKAFEGHRLGKPQVDEVSFVRMPDGEKGFELATRSQPAVILGVPHKTYEKHQNDPRFRFQSRPGLTIHYLVTNMKTPAKGRPKNPLLDVRVRRALRAGIDYKTLCERFMPGQVFAASQLVTPGIFGFDPTLKVPEFVPGEARRLLGEAGYPEGLDLTLNVSEQDLPFADEISRELLAEGIRVTSVPAADLVQHDRMTTCEGDLHLGGWVCATGDAAELFEGNFYRTSAGAASGCGYARPELSDLLDRTARTLEPADRQALLQSAMRLVMEDLPWIPLIGGHDRYAVSPSVTWEPRADGEIYVADVRLP